MVIVITTSQKSFSFLIPPKADLEDLAGLVEGDLAPLKTPLVNARTGLATNLGQVLEETDVGQHKCLHLVLLRFFG